MLDASWYIAYPATMLGPVLPPEFRSPAAALDSLADGPAARASHPDDRTR